MNFRTFVVGLGLLTADCLVSGPADACSVVGDYVRPSNFELVQIADAIVIATPEASHGEDSVRFRVERAVKGSPDQSVTLTFSALGRTTPSDLNDLSSSNPEGHMGPCNRMTFARGSRYLLFLSRGADGSWSQLGFPFSRVNEDYSGENTIWMRTVRRYLAVQGRLAPMAQLDALRELLASGRDAEGIVLTPAERSDITDHLASLSQWKPTAYLLEAFGRVEQGETVALRSDEVNQEAGNLDELAALLLGETAAASVPSERDRVRRAILQALVEGQHPQALPLFERLAQAPNASVADQAYALRFFAANGQYPRAYRWIEQNVMNMLPRLDVADQTFLIRAVADVQRGESYEEGQERWRSDPHAVATWPELALSLHWYQRQAVGADRALPFGNAIGAIPVTDFRARPLLTIARADVYDEEVDRWATAELLERPVPPASQGEEDDNLESDPAMLPLRVLVGSWSDSRTQSLRRVFCQGGRRRSLVIAALGLWGDDLYEQFLLAPIATMPDLSDDERVLIRRAALGFASRASQPHGMRWDGIDDDAFLVDLIKERPNLASPRPCSG